MGFSEQQGNFILQSNGYNHIHGKSNRGWQVLCALELLARSLASPFNVGQRGRMQHCIKGWIAICAGVAFSQSAF
ncbi:MAG TPA: hypothetical protein VN019_08205, partial [Oxalicibacterium sp.]|nr:hypothetical protein [Oxalicibacterium sp.]